MREAAEKSAVVIKEEGLEHLTPKQKSTLVNVAAILLRLQEEGKTGSTLLRIHHNRGLPTQLYEEPQIAPIKHIL